MIRQAQALADNRTSKFTLKCTQNPNVVIYFSQLFLCFSVKNECFLIKLKHQMIIRWQFNASIFLFSLHYFWIKFVLFLVENNGSVTFFVFLCFSHNIANLGFDKAETVVKPGLDELFELLFLNIGVFDDILFFE